MAMIDKVEDTRAGLERAKQGLLEAESRLAHVQAKVQEWQHGPVQGGRQHEERIQLLSDLLNAEKEVEHTRANESRASTKHTNTKLRLDTVKNKVSMYNTLIDLQQFIASTKNSGQTTKGKDNDSKRACGSKRQSMLVRIIGNALFKCLHEPVTVKSIMASDPTVSDLEADMIVHVVDILAPFFPAPPKDCPVQFLPHPLLRVIPILISNTILAACEYTTHCVRISPRVSAGQRYGVALTGIGCYEVLAAASAHHFDVYEEGDVMISNRNNANKAREHMLGAFFDIDYIKIVLHKIFKCTFEWRATEIHVLARKLPHDGIRRPGFPNRNAFRENTKNGRDVRGVHPPHSAQDLETGQQDTTTDVSKRIQILEAQIAHQEQLEKLHAAQMMSSVGTSIWTEKDERDIARQRLADYRRHLRQEMSLLKFLEKQETAPDKLQALHRSIVSQPLPSPDLTSPTNNSLQPSQTTPCLSVASSSSSSQSTVLLSQLLPTSEQDQGQKPLSQHTPCGASELNDSFRYNTLWQLSNPPGTKERTTYSSIPLLPKETHGSESYTTPTASNPFTQDRSRWLDLSRMLSYYNLSFSGIDPGFVKLSTCVALPESELLYRVECALLGT
ncbi:hypothetical protein BGZ74_000551 [Mortierella antarctica]|nr:hypothetical protein BGZ74_000551 [Mortierella antarctica]